jgi:transposase-like protein
MTRRITRDPIYRGRHSSAETIELCVRWYITYRLSHRDLAAMMAEREIVISHTTIMRWVLRYVPEYERRWARFARPPGSSWRMDEPRRRVSSESSRLHSYGRPVQSKGREAHRRAV